MNPDRLTGAWHQIENSIRERWDKLTDDDLRELRGHGERLVRKLQQRYGLPCEEAEREARVFLGRIHM